MKNFFVILLIVLSCNAYSQHQMWISESRLQSLLQSGAAWDNLVNGGDQSVNPNLSNQDDNSNVYVMARALLYVATSQSMYKDEVVNACISAIETENGGRTLALARELGAYVVAADMVELPEPEQTQFKMWLSDVRYETLDGKTLISTHEERPNNWGTHAGFSRLAAAIYLDDQSEIDRCIQVFKGWLGDLSSYNGFSYGDLDWQADPNNPVGINPQGATKNGHNIDGVLPDDQRRGGGFTWPPPAENYVYEALQGVSAMAVLLHQIGYTDVWQWQNSAILRAYQWLHTEANFPASGDDKWQIYIINYYYGTSFPVSETVSPGKNVGWTDFTHAEVDTTTHLPNLPENLRIAR